MAEKDDKKEGHGAAAKGKPAAGGGGMMIPVVAVVLALGLAVGVGWYLYTLVRPPPAEAAGGHDGDAHGEGKEAAGHKDNLLHTATEVVLGDIMSNVRGQGGRRYVKLTVAVWVHAKVGSRFGGGGGHGGGGGGDSLKRILQSLMEEHLKSYELEELNDPNINRNLDRGFRQLMEKELHALFPDIPADQKLVQRIVITNLLVQ